MSPLRWREIERVFNEAVERPENERDAFLAAVCAKDPKLRKEVEALLAQKLSEKNLLDQPAWELLEGSADYHSITVAISSGTQLGPYKIEALLGAGGMGEVFRAYDTRLGRIVAIKVLPGAFSSDPSRTRRLLQEARAASALNHPNIITVHDISSDSGIDFLVTEYVPGNSLKELLSLGSLPLMEVLDCVAQAADGLAAAHAAGIVHRDIKPGNIMITPQRQVKVLDFGIAKLNPRLQECTTETRTQTTSPGTVIGTLAYMSPEQTRGEEIDGRSDIFSLCVVLYEAATGRLPFRGVSALSLLHAIATVQPAKASTIDKRIPNSLNQLLSRGLAKDPADRFQNASELAEQLRNLTGSKQIRRFSSLAIVTCVGVMTIALGLFGWWSSKRQASNSVGTPRIEQITNFVGTEGETAPSGLGSPALSGDGKLLAFIHDSQVWIKLLPAGEPTQLTHDLSPKFDLAFSPDGSHIAYSVISRDNSWDTWEIPTFGGEPYLWLPNASGLSWTGPNTVLFSEIKTGMHMAVVAANTNRTSSRDIYVPPDNRGMAHQSYLSPDRKRVLLTEMDRGGWLPCRVVPADGGSPGARVGSEKGQCTQAAWSPDGRWMYTTTNASGEQQIWRQAFPDGVPQQLTFGPSTASGIAVAPDGKSLITYIGFVQHAIFIHDGRGDRAITTQGDSILPAWGDGFPTSIFSHDGSRLYYLLHSEVTRAFGGGELWAHDFATGANDPVLTGMSVTSFDLSPDGQTIVFSALDQKSVPRLWTARLDRRTVARRMLPGEARGPVFGHDGVIYFDGPEGSQYFIFAFNPETGAVRKLVAEPSVDAPAVSPDRKWVVVTVPFPGPDATSLVKAYRIGAGAPVAVCQRCFLKWSGDQRTLYVSFHAANSSGNGKTLVISLNEGEALPKLPKNGLTIENGARIPGAKFLPLNGLFPGARGSQYAYVKLLSTENLYRVTLPR